MADEIDLSTPGAWRQTESLTLLRRVMDLGGSVRHTVSGASGLSEKEIHALEHLARGPLGPAEIARLLDVTTAASTGIVDRLETRGHAERRPHPIDRRRTAVTITESARHEVMRHMGPMFRALAEADAALTDEERAVVVRYLGAALAAAEHVEGNHRTRRVVPPA
ncbi:MarR family winged helix-turn-helix transcriptional regulator [Miniimonas sp. S16]|uniref:MarR family winged helix-turn-helix transcriptional regulator n=1 Tax=Miniimonas sp. S16 TaxID=2171623 RepID=UPI000D5296C5|nr:MarR family transcriptional regulator [Miniimonas sp. S16]